MGSDQGIVESGADGITIRDSRPDDAAAIAAIYAGHVRDGLASFEIEPPDAAEIARRRDAVLAAGWPYLVACEAQRIVGYAYASTYRPRPAYRFTVENSIYLDPAASGRGIGGRLLRALVEACTKRGARQMIAVIGDSANTASIGLHASAGFRFAGVLRAAGFKHGRWVDSVFMQRALGDGDASEPADQRR